MMHKTRSRIAALAFLAFAVGACTDGPTSPANAQAGTLQLPSDIRAAVIELETTEPIDSVRVGYGKTATVLPSVANMPYRVMVFDLEKPLPTTLPLRVYVGTNLNAPVKATVLEVSDAHGNVAEPKTSYWIR